MRPRDNPFNTRRVETLRVRLPEGSIEALLQQLDRLGSRAAIVGPEGSGKTTLLEQMRTHLLDDGERPLWLQLNRQNRRPPWAELGERAPHHTVLLDGAEQLGTLAWRRFHRLTRHCRRLVVTQHTPGRLPCLIQMRPTRQLLGELVLELTQAAPPPDLDLLFEVHNGNIRDIFRVLYDRWAVQEHSNATAGEAC